MTSVGILGAGALGMAVATGLFGTDYRLRIAGRSVAATAARVAAFLPGTAVVPRAEAYAADIVVLAIPLHRYRDLPREALAGRVVVDAMNHLPAVDGPLEPFATDPRTSSEIVQEHLADSSVVRTLNHIGAREIGTDARPSGEPGRRALALAGDDAAARARVARLVDILGFDPVDAGPLANNRPFAPGGRVYHGRWTAPGMRAALGLS